MSPCRPGVDIHRTLFHGRQGQCLPCSRFVLCAASRVVVWDGNKNPTRATQKRFHGNEKSHRDAAASTHTNKCDESNTLFLIHTPTHFILTTLPRRQPTTSCTSIFPRLSLSLSLSLSHTHTQTQTHSSTPTLVYCTVVLFVFSHNSNERNNNNNNKSNPNTRKLTQITSHPSIHRSIDPSIHHHQQHDEPCFHDTRRTPAT